MTRTIVTLILLLCLMVRAEAGGLCGKRAELVKALGRVYHESGRAMGITKEINLVDIFASGPGGTWTILLTTPDGRACIIAAGNSWEEAPPPKVTVREEKL